jgi:uncharacterized protein YbjT (DUF2867 family)
LSVAAASLSSGVDTVTGEGLTDTLKGADVIVDVSSPLSAAGYSASDFFEASTRHLLTGARAAGARHYIALSVVGIEGLTASAYFRGKRAQEQMIAGDGIPFTIIRSTQFFEFIVDVVQEGDEREIRISPALVQPIAADDVVQSLSRAILEAPASATMEIAGPERMALDEIASEIATANEDRRSVIADPRALYFGAEIAGEVLLPGPHAKLGSRRFDDWLRKALQPQTADSLPN